MSQLIIGVSPSSFAESDQTPLDLLNQANVQIKENPFKRRLTEDEAAHFVKDIDGLIAGVEPLTKKVLYSANNLKAIARVGIGMSNIDFEAAKELGIKISNTPDGPTEAVAEMTITSLLTIARNLVQFNEDLHNGVWKKFIGSSLIGKTILIIGYGRIGKRFAQLANSFGAKILVNDPFIQNQESNTSLEFVTLEEGLSKADVISLHAAGEKSILGLNEFSKMKNGVIILNSARGGLIDDDAFIKAIESKKVSGAWFDVFEKEPYTGKLQKYNNVLLTPHIGTYTKQCRLSMEVASVNNILHDLELKS